jgi:hypothetical protein
MQIPKHHQDTGANHAVSAMKYQILAEFIELGWSVLLRCACVHACVCASQCVEGVSACVEGMWGAHVWKGGPGWGGVRWDGVISVHTTTRAMASRNERGYVRALALVSPVHIQPPTSYPTPACNDSWHGWCSCPL